MVLLCPVVGVATLLTSCSRPGVHASSPAVSAPRASGPVQRLSQPQQKAVAGPVDPDRRVGAIFIDNGPLHVCTGSVVHSAGGNLVMTAAHCLAGASQITFVPGFAGDAAPAPADVWKADAVYLDPRWTASKDPHADYAIARVSNDAGASVEAHVGLALTLGTAPPPGSHVTVLGYPAGVGGSPVGCQASTSVTESGFPSVGVRRAGGRHQRRTLGQRHHAHRADRWFRARWVRRERVVLGAVRRTQTAQLLARAEAGGPGDPVPNDLDDSC